MILNVNFGKLLFNLQYLFIKVIFSKRILTGSSNRVNLKFITEFDILMALYACMYVGKLFISQKKTIDKN